MFNFKNKKIFLSILLFFIFIFFILYFINFSSYFTKKEIINFNLKKDSLAIGKIDRVIDGDTVILNINGKRERIRLIGLNAPEAKAVNGRVVECFGREASKKAKEILHKKDKVYFERDKMQSKRDKYGRLLSYIFLENGENFAEKMITDGYGYEYTYHGQKYKYQKNFKNAQVFAQKHQLGLWSRDACNGELMMKK